ncbi:MAG: hybrid sensor histidine kinase/response regulator [Coleofasciculaceae cyanobacterium SM2_1_6]|nr:hybrid sensor histidine kinase/response regulator [Coleofasciculaceae cyanobacterium SM2_1_6]
MGTNLTGLILIVDDNPTNLDVISEALKDAGYKVAIATSGERAIQQAERRPPDLILLDVMMPGINGFETCKHLKSNTKTCDIPIIFMTALTDTDHKVKGFDLGAVDYITKPFQEQEVLVRVRNHLQLSLLTKNLEEQVAHQTSALQATQLQLIQSEKLSSLGNLVAGIAHEMNNPLGFIAASLKQAKPTFADIIEHLKLYQEQFPDKNEEILNHAEEIDLEYSLKDLPKMIDSLEMACDRLRNISISLRTFSRADTEYKVDFYVYEGIDSTILILKHRLQANDKRPAIEVITEYGNIPQIKCFPGQLNQVFMNILANAIEALEESNQGRSFAEIEVAPNRIMIESSIENDQVKIAIRDNGKGMSEDMQGRIFDYLFTTKEVGKGTGLGLAIAKQIVEEKHQGTITVNSKLGQGTEFMITLPIN